MRALAAPLLRGCASIRGRLGFNDAASWRRLGWVTLFLYAAKGLGWIAVGHFVFGR